MTKTTQSTSEEILLNEAKPYDERLIACHMREIIRLAFNENAVGIVLYHNHSSGDPTSSANDVLFTSKLRDSLQLCDLSLIDHVIVSTMRYVSMRDRGFV